MRAPSIEFWQVIAFSAFIVLSSITSLILRLKLEKDLWVGAVRTTSQLFLMGFVLKYIFDHPNFFLVIGLFVWMTFWAARIINKRIKNKPFEVQQPVFLSMIVTYILISSVTTGGLLQVRPWFKPEIFIPLAGMVVGNSMNAIAISLDRLFTELRDKRGDVEQMLAFGATASEASHSVIQSAVKTGMIPAINAMMSVGLVFIPGMMTGQILGGEDPLSAAKYQIMIMLMISASTALGCSLVTILVAKRCFTEKHQLKYWE